MLHLAATPPFPVRPTTGTQPWPLRLSKNQPFRFDHCRLSRCASLAASLSRCSTSLSRCGTSLAAAHILLQLLRLRLSRCAARCRISLATSLATPLTASKLAATSLPWRLLLLHILAASLAVGTLATAPPALRLSLPPLSRGISHGRDSRQCVSLAVPLLSSECLAIRQTPTRSPGPSGGIPNPDDEAHECCSLQSSTQRGAPPSPLVRGPTFPAVHQLGMPGIPAAHPIPTTMCTNTTPSRAPSLVEGPALLVAHSPSPMTGRTATHFRPEEPRSHNPMSATANSVMGTNGASINHCVFSLWG